jgi:hypothetical protein
MIELVQQHFPLVGEKELRSLFNSAQDDFCSQTEIIKDTFTQNSVAGQRYYTLDPLIIKVTSVQINDVEIPRLIGSPIIDDDEFDDATGLTAATASSNDRYWFIDTGRLGLVEKGTLTRDGKTSKYQSISEIKELRLFTIARGTDFTIDLTEESRLPSEFQMALVYKTLSDSYLKAGDTLNPQASQLFDMKYTKLVKDAKKQARSNNIGGAAIIAPTDF